MDTTDQDSSERAGGWKRLTKKIAYDNPWIQVSHEEVQRPNGSEGIYGVVHFKSRAIGVVAIDSDDTTWLVKQSRYPNNEFTIEIPEGGGPLDEAPIEAAKRELKEEVGLIADHWEPLLEMRTSNSVTDEVAYVFLASDLTQGEQALEETEDIEVIKVPFSDAVEMALDGAIVDAISVAAILKVALLRERNASR
jgi:8-oxo-dGTP pyrophosphatase MutT (NUDIX family)